MIKKICILIIMITPLLTACWDSHEPERQMYAHGLGVDYKDNKYTVYVQIINLSLLAKSESSGGDKKIKYELGKASGNSVEEAIIKLYRSTQSKVFWGHLNYIVFTTSLIDQDSLKPVVDYIERYFEAHYRVWMYVCNEPLEKILKTTSILGMSMEFTRLSNPSVTTNKNFNVAPVDLRNLSIALDEPPYRALVPLITYSNDTWESNEGEDSVIKFDGLAVLSEKEMKRIFNNHEIAGYRWVKEEFTNQELIVQPSGPENIGLLINDMKVKVKPNSNIKNNSPSFEIEVKAKGSITHMGTDLQLNKIKQKGEEVIKQDILKTFNTALESDIDIYNLSNRLYKKNLKQWNKVQEKGKIPLTPESLHVSVDLFIKDSGGHKMEPAFD
ncbi:Ger(x)C family spore germination protein [Cytobacillus sp. Sa5YUA1]|uniref:Ger(X)C family spore germination protein n=1 Tax=Cytobacillus stercorigallinarum TaxID=2762240 RepID=A0ABR8QLN0_9BACI|nr:Ger(x)C family spore germination protein [Cytobacillus stercorigallinarum]MBD7936430.1 Ger(x)C family spore germination protein [Cytobacillus stercorigallinarum]